MQMIAWCRKCPWAHVVIPFTQSCVSQSVAPRPILAHERLCLSRMSLSQPVIILSLVTSEPVYWTCGLFQTGVFGASHTFPSLLLPASQLVGAEISFACACSSSIMSIYSSKVIAEKPLSKKCCYQGQCTFNPLSTIEATLRWVDPSSTSCGSSNGHLRVAPKGRQSQQSPKWTFPTF